MMSQMNENDTGSASSASTLPPARERAEVLVDQLSQRLEKWSSSFGNGLQRIWARTREEGEDIWAEAQDIRRRARNGSSS